MAVLTGARRVYSVFGPKTAAKPISDTNSLKVLWEAPNSSIPFLAGVISDKHNMLGITDTHGFSEEKVEFKDVNFFFTRIRDENLVDEVDDAIGCDDVLLQHHLNAVDGQAVAITADLYGAALCCLIHRACHDGL